MATAATTTITTATATITTTMILRMREEGFRRYITHTISSHTLSHIIPTYHISSYHLIILSSCHPIIIHLDHGFPVRVIIPGYIGGRMIKWLTNVDLIDTISQVSTTIAYRYLRYIPYKKEIPKV